MTFVDSHCKRNGQRKLPSLKLERNYRKSSERSKVIVTTSQIHSIMIASKCNPYLCYLNIQNTVDYILITIENEICDNYE